MIQLIQVFRFKEIFFKGSYNPENRKAFQDIETVMDSSSGYLSGNTLYLPREYENNTDIHSSSLIILQDIKGWDGESAKKRLERAGMPDWYIESKQDFMFRNNQTLFHFSQLNSPKSFEIFRMQQASNKCFDLFLNYSSNPLSIGIPERQDHKICELRPAQAVQYKINGKSDFTMTGRKQRTFQEYTYIIEWMGQADKIAFLEPNEIQRKKSIPLDRCKVIDERKILR